MDAQRLLVVDDDPALVELMRRYLTRLGFQVETCTSGAEACRIFEQDPAGFAAVVADLSLEDVSGAEIAARCAALSPRIRILLSSGYPFSVETIPESWRARVAFLQKPFAPKMLGEAVQSLLAG